MLPFLISFNIEILPYLWFLQESYKNYLSSKLSSLSLITSDYWFQLILANLKIENNTRFESQSTIIDAYSSNLIINDASFVKIDVDSASIMITSSTSNIKNVSATSISKSVQNIPYSTLSSLPFV